MHCNCGKLTFPCFYLPFGTTPTPEEYTTISESVIDFSNDIPTYASWDTRNLQSPFRHLLPGEKYLPPSDLLVHADQLAVDIKSKVASMYGFINSIVAVTIDEPGWVECAKNSSLLVIHTIFRSLQPSEPLKRNDHLSLRNLAG